MKPVIKPKSIVVAGAGQAGCQIIDSLVRSGYEGTIHLVGEEPQLPYQRPPLSKSFLADEVTEERLWLKPDAFYQQANVSLHLQQRLEAIDRKEKTLQLSDGSQLAYDKLALCLGTRPRLLPLEGADAKGMCYLRTMDDVNHIKTLLPSAQHITIIGAGFIGLETAAMLTKMGKQVTVIEMQDRVLPRVVAPEVSQYFYDLHTQNGVSIKLQTQVQAIATYDGRITSIETSEGAITTDLCVVGIGVIPNVEVAQTAGLECSNGIVVNEFAQTSDDHIVAAGDCAQHPNAFYGSLLRLESVHNAIEQSKSAAASLLGEALAYQQHPWFWSDQFDVKLQMVGLSQGYDQLVFRGEPSTKRFSVFYFQADKLLAVDSINQPLEHMLSRKLLANVVAITPEQAQDTTFNLKEAVK